MTKDEFTHLVTADQPDAPAYFTFDAILNTRERPTLDQAMQQGLQPVELAELLDLGDAGAQILDVRDAAEYAKAHVAGSINIALDGQYATWAGTLLDPAKPIVIVSEPGREQEAALRLGRIGFDHVEGFLADGMAALAARLDLLQTTERISAPMLAENLTRPDPPLVVDIRAQSEWSAKHLEGSLNLPLGQLQTRIAEVPETEKIALHCAGGYRSSIAIGILVRNGIANVVEVGRRSCRMGGSQPSNSYKLLTHRWIPGLEPELRGQLPFLSRMSASLRPGISRLSAFACIYRHLTNIAN
jgi:hydroxyacylglutathione hydrolase